MVGEPLHRSGAMRLVIRLVSQLVGITLICLAVTLGWVMIDAHRMIDAETGASAERVAHELENLYWREILWRGSLRRDRLLLPIPEWQSLATLKLVSPGVCVVVGPGAREPRTLCSQIEGVGTPAPDWFAQSYETLFGAPAAIARPLTIRQPDIGEVIATPDPGAAVRLAWRQISVVIGVAATMGVAICLLAALAVYRALAPTRDVIDGLRRMEAGDYRRRIETFARGEFALIARAANDLAARLAQTTAERAALTKRLFEVQEEERRALARDLHDEFGQCLTAVAAYAASIEAGATEKPDLAEDARAISRVARRMHGALRDALARLRSQDLDELGLEASLAQLAASWNARSQRCAVVHLDICGDLASVPPTVATNVYRIAQEFLTNAMRHGAPTDVYLRVERDAAQAGAVALTVEDDGGGDPARLGSSSGHGILGVRERVSAFGGSLAIDRAARGVRVAARIPVAPPLQKAVAA
jgi:two-component system, NarL family, sensor histidine kinase UhpB